MAICSFGKLQNKNTAISRKQEMKKPKVREHHSQKLTNLCSGWVLLSKLIFRIATMDVEISTTIVSTS